jgi:RND family efflux transporter MFP subunit
VRWLPLLLLLSIGCREPDPVAKPPPPPPARDAGVAATDDAAPTKLVGVLTAAEQADVGPRTAGKILKVNVASGDRVALDQVLVEMDPVQQQEERRAAEAALAAASAAARQAKVDLDAARRTVERDTPLAEKGVLATAELDDAKFEVKRAEAALSRAYSNQTAEASRARTAKDHVTDTELKAPFAGTVVNRYRDPGNRVEANTPVLKLVRQGAMVLRFAIPPPLVPQFPAGAKVPATIETVTGTITATIKHVGAALDAPSGMVFAEAELDNQPGDLRPGLTAWVGAPAPKSQK